MNTRHGLVAKAIGTAVAALLTIAVSAVSAEADSQSASGSVVLKDTNW